MKISYIISGLLVALLLSFSSVQAQVNPKDRIINSKKINIAFTSEYEQSDLDEVKNELKKLDILLTYTSLQFTPEGKLKQISASIEYPDGVKGSFISRELGPMDGPGFRRKLRGIFKI